MADRLFADKKYVRNLIQNDIDRVDMLGFSKEGDRSDIYLFAIALGVDKGIRTPSEIRNDLILERVAQGKPFLMSFLYSIALEELRKEGRENQIDDTDEVYRIAEEYANTGFSIILDMIPDFDEYDEEEFQLDMLQKLDKKYKEVVAKD